MWKDEALCLVLLPMARGAMRKNKGHYLELLVTVS